MKCIASQGSSTGLPGAFSGSRIGKDYFVIPESAKTENNKACGGSIVV
jgi:hypothetical protein